ncbi:MAG: type II toxin-antitoxin system RatA family toxin [Tahibacter sp.]
MIQIRRSALVRYSPDQMFDLVNDVEAYPKRFAWCAGAQILARDETTLTARLDARFAGITQSFTTRNTPERPHRIGMDLVDGPFSSLEGAWTFTALGNDGCKIAFALDFDYSGGLIAAALRVGFQGLADRMVDDFCREATRLYD